MNKLHELGVLRWYRYVDDVFATLSRKDRAEEILSFLNKQHKNIEFTIEHEEEDKLPFLDTLVKRKGSQYWTTVYRKKTFTGVYLNWTSLTARRYKIGLINCLAERIWRTCSQDVDKELELEKLKLILKRNEYPETVIDRTLNRFRERKAKQVTLNKEEKPEKRFLKLPYVSRKCEDFAYRLKGLVEKSYGQVEFNVAFQAPMNLGKLFPFKDGVKNEDERASVVYSLRCKPCGAQYIGKTDRILYWRLKEFANNKESACRKHLDENPTHRIDKDSVEILDSADSWKKLAIKELLHILRKEPVLNTSANKQSEHDLKTLLVKRYPQFRGK